MLTVQIKGMEKINRMMDKASRNIERDVEKEFRRTAIIYMNNVKMAMKKTPRMTTRSYTANRSKPHRPSMPGHPPAIDTGNLLNSIQIRNISYGAEVYVWGAPYAKFLEEGTDRMEARPVWENELQKIDVKKRILDVIDRSLN